MPTSFDQVHLPPHTIDSVRTVVSLPLLYPAAFQQGILKSHGINGVLLFGPPGTGKTLVAKALAKEAGCRMMAINPSDVMDMVLFQLSRLLMKTLNKVGSQYVGEGEKLVKSVFSLARRLSPCVVFLDEIDALFGARLSARESGSAFAHRGVITEFMQEMDGLRSSSERSGRRKGARNDNQDRVIVIGATNRPFDLDDAVLRRLPRRLLLDLPGEREREGEQFDLIFYASGPNSLWRSEILRIHLRGETLDSDVDVKVLAKRTESFSGSDLKRSCRLRPLFFMNLIARRFFTDLCVSAALDAVKESVKLPWKTSDQPNDASDMDTNVPQSATSSSPTTSDGESIGDHVRVLSHRHFNKALKEIIPSSSESLGSLVDLRKWNEEFGEGRADRKRQQVWGKGTFGFVEAEKNHDVGVGTPTVIQNVRGDK
jgi:SpoVK/Ycf46/Vps4 family AAA+-type ATPase